jgi:hypothetical protein
LTKLQGNLRNWVLKSAATLNEKAAISQRHCSQKQCGILRLNGPGDRADFCTRVKTLEKTDFRFQCERFETTASQNREPQL